MAKMSETRPWGQYKIIADEDDFKVKIITVIPKKRLSLQSHMMRDERWCVIKGRGVVTIETDSMVEAGDTVFIPRGKKHRIKNISETELVFVEVQTGSYFGEDDIVRFEDDFGRQ